MDITECGEEYWDSFVDRSPQGTVFNKSFFLKSYHLPVKYLICRKGNEDVAGYGFVESDQGIAIMPHQHISGIIFKDLSELKDYTKNETIFFVLETFARYLFDRYKMVHLNCHWDIKDMRAFDWINYHERDKGYYQILPRYTSLLDITDPSSTDAYAQKRRIPELKKGLKEGYQFETRQINDIGLLNDFVGMNFTRQDLARSTEEVKCLEAVCRSLMEHNSAKLLATYVNGEPAVITCFAYDHRRAYYLFVGTDLKWRDWGVGTKNLYESCKMLNQELGLNELDMVGINSPLAGQL